MSQSINNKKKQVYLMAGNKKYRIWAQRGTVALLTQEPASGLLDWLKLVRLVK